jgi:hypothetical protein
MKEGLLWCELLARLSSFLSATPTSRPQGEDKVRNMDARETAYFDLKTVALLRETVEDAWVCLRPEQRETISRSLLAERILKAAAQGERDPQRLLGAALMGIAA